MDTKQTKPTHNAAEMMAAAIKKRFGDHRNVEIIREGNLTQVILHPEETKEPAKDR